MCMCAVDNKAKLIIKGARERDRLYTEGLDMRQRNQIGGKWLLKIRHNHLLAVGQVCNCPRSPECLCNVLQLLLKFDD